MQSAANHVQRKLSLFSLSSSDIAADTEADRVHIYLRDRLILAISAAS
jgi:hypothetical protein